MKYVSKRKEFSQKFNYNINIINEQQFFGGPWQTKIDLTTFIKKYVITIIRVTIEAPVASFLELGLATGATSVKPLHPLVDSLVLSHPLPLFCPGCSFLHRFWIQGEGGERHRQQCAVGWAKAGTWTEVPATDLAIAACIDASISTTVCSEKYPSPVGTAYSWV